MTTPERLWIFNHHAAAPDQSAGTRHYDLASRLVRRGIDVTIFAAGFNHFTGREERLRPWQLKRVEIVGGVRFVWVRTYPYRGNDFRRIASMGSYLVMSILAQIGHPRPTHVIGSTVHPLAAIAAYFVARARRAAFFFEIRDLWPQTLIDLGLIREGSLRATVLRAIERFLINRARAVIAVLPGIHDYIRDQRLEPRGVAYIPNGVDLTKSAPLAATDPALARMRALRDAGRFVAIYAGSHALVNRLDVVLDAAALLLQRSGSSVHVVLAGDGRERPALEARAASLGLANVEFLGPVPKRNIPRLLEAADVCLLHVTASPVYRFGVSFNKLFDYLASRKPIVFACHSAYDPVAEAGCGLSIPPDDPAALADALDRLQRTPAAELDAMGRNGLRWVAQHHDMDELARSLLAALRR